MRILVVFAIPAILLLHSGCGQAPAPQQAERSAEPAVVESEEAVTGFTAQRPEKTYTDPSEAVSDFLVAVKSGEEAVATALLTTGAQREAWTNGLAISGEGFPAAKFDVSEVEYLNQNTEAHVMSTWADQTPQGERKTFQCVWLLRHEPHGWCIYGMATKFLEHLQPVVLNFENQVEMQKRQQWAEQQIVKHRELQLHQQQVAAQETQQQPADLPATSGKRQATQQPVARQAARVDPTGIQR